jgi:hypothetical protein
MAARSCHAQGATKCLESKQICPINRPFLIALVLHSKFKDCFYLLRAATDIIRHVVPYAISDV